MSRPTGTKPSCLATLRSPCNLCRVVGRSSKELLFGRSGSLETIASFNHKQWQHSQAISLVWQGTVDYARID
jgi:hypothetical protein